MRTIKIIALLVGLTFLMSSCYTQLALVQHERPQKVYSQNNDNGEYYYPPNTSDTLYQDESPEIVQNFYYGNPYYDPYDLSLNIGFYGNWWWDDFYYTAWPFIGFRPLRPVLLYPLPYWGVYDPFYWDIYNPYYDYGWGWYPGATYGTNYGPRPFTKGGSMVRGAGSRRVRISHKGRTDIGSGSSGFLPTRVSGTPISGRSSVTVRKRTGRSTIIENPTGTRRVLRKGTATTTKRGTVIKRRGRSSRTVISKRGTTVRGRRYFPITVKRSTRRQTIVNQTKPRPQPKLKTRTHRSTRYRNAGTYESHRWSPPSSSTGSSRPSYSAPARSYGSHSGSVRSSSRSSSSRSSGSRRAVRRR